MFFFDCRHVAHCFEFLQEDDSDDGWYDIVGDQLLQRRRRATDDANPGANDGPTPVQHVFPVVTKVTPTSYMPYTSNKVILAKLNGGLRDRETTVTIAIAYRSVCVRKPFRAATPVCPPPPPPHLTLCVCVCVYLSLCDPIMLLELVAIIL